MSSTDPWIHAERLKKAKRTKANHRLTGAIEGIVFNEMNERNEERDTEHLHPSEMAKNDWCLRQSYYKMTKEKESNPESTANFRRMNIFAEGHAIHDKWQEWLRRAGILWGNWKCIGCYDTWEALAPAHCPSCGNTRTVRYAEVPLYSKKYHIIGHTDGVIRDDEGEALLEIKSVGLGTIRWDAPQMYEAYEDGRIDLDELWKRIKRPLAAHNRQIQLYMFILGIHKAVVIYEWKPTQEVREFKVDLDMEVVQPLLDGALAVQDSLKDKVPPLRFSGATRSSKACRFCPYKTTCYDSETAASKDWPDV